MISLFKYLIIKTFKEKSLYVTLFISFLFLFLLKNYIYLNYSKFVSPTVIVKSLNLTMPTTMIAVFFGFLIAKLVSGLMKDGTILTLISKKPTRMMLFTVNLIIILIFTFLFSTFAVGSEFLGQEMAYKIGRKHIDWVTLYKPYYYKMWVSYLVVSLFFAGFIFLLTSFSTEKAVIGIPLIVAVILNIFSAFINATLISNDIKKMDNISPSTIVNSSEREKDIDDLKVNDYIIKDKQYIIGNLTKDYYDYLTGWKYANPSLYFVGLASYITQDLFNGENHIWIDYTNRGYVNRSGSQLTEKDDYDYIIQGGNAYPTTPMSWDIYRNKWDISDSLIKDSMKSFVRFWEEKKAQDPNVEKLSDWWNLKNATNYYQLYELYDWAVQKKEPWVSKMDKQWQTIKDKYDERDFRLQQTLWQMANLKWGDYAKTYLHKGDNKKGFTDAFIPWDTVVKVKDSTGKMVEHTWEDVVKGVILPVYTAIYKNTDTTDLIKHMVSSFRNDLYPGIFMDASFLRWYWLMVRKDANKPQDSLFSKCFNDKECKEKNIRIAGGFANDSVARTWNLDVMDFEDSDLIDLNKDRIIDDSELKHYVYSNRILNKIYIELLFPRWVPFVVLLVSAFLMFVSAMFIFKRKNIM